MLAAAAAPAVAVAVALGIAGGAPPPGAVGAQDAWSKLQLAAALAAGVDVGASPMHARVRALERGWGAPLLDEEAGESLQAVRTAQPAVDALDAALVAGNCTLPPGAGDAAFAGVIALADHALAAALVDALDAGAGSARIARVAAGVGRAGDLSTLLALRCGRPSLASFDAALTIHERARSVAWTLALGELVDAAALARLAASLPPPSPAGLERIAPAAARKGQGARVEALGKRLDEATRDHAALMAASASQAALAALPRPSREVVVKCDAHAEAGPGGAHKYSVTRHVARELRRRGVEIALADSRVTPAQSGGMRVDAAGPVAQSCGLQLGDVIVEVNGIPASLATVSAVTTDVTRKEHAAVRLERNGRVLDVDISVRR